MGLVNGSDEYWDIVKHAERIYRKKCESSSSSEREKWTEKGHKLADTLREDYGYSDSVVSGIIEEYDLNRD